MTNKQVMDAVKCKEKFPLIQTRLDQKEVSRHVV